jgi:hypothetical protein
MIFNPPILMVISQIKGKTINAENEHLLIDQTAYMQCCNTQYTQIREKQRYKVGL